MIWKTFGIFLWQCFSLFFSQWNFFALWSFAKIEEITSRPVFLYYVSKVVVSCCACLIGRDKGYWASSYVHAESMFCWTPLQRHHYGRQYQLLSKKYDAIYILRNLVRQLMLIFVWGHSQTTLTSFLFSWPPSQHLWQFIKIDTFGLRTLGLTQWNLNSFELKFDDTRHSS